MSLGKGWGPKPKGRIADYLATQKNSVLLGDIQTHMMKEHSKPSNRRQDVIHPSEMAKTGWCPRSTYYRIQACRDAKDPFLKPAESVGVQLLNIFDEGHYIHDKWQKRLRDMGYLWGNWKCISCDEMIRDSLFPEHCGCCGAYNTLIYTEVPLRAPQYLISGHADGAVPKINGLIEIKSVGTGTVRIEAPDIFTKNSEGQKIDLTNLWKDIQEPFPAHIRQGQLYLALCKIMGLPFDQIVFIYEAKFNQGAKEFAVKYDPSIGNALLAQAEEIVKALDSNGPIPKCPTGTCKDCEKYIGTEVTERVGKSTEQSTNEGASRPRNALRRPTRTTRKIVRPS